jgi:hypothetical protein
MSAQYLAWRVLGSWWRAAERVELGVSFCLAVGYQQQSDRSFEAGFEVLPVGHRFL